jgi:hypothetical protein
LLCRKASEFLLLRRLFVYFASTMGLRNFSATILLLMTTAVLADALPQASDLQKMLDGNDFHGAVVGAGQLLGLSGTAGSLVDRGLVLAIKAEGYLQLKNYQQAADTFSSAAKEEGDPARSAADKANEILIRRSPTGTYLPRVAESDGEKPTPINILNRSSRPVVYPILFKDEWASDQAEFTQGRSTHDMTLLLQTLEKAATLRELELAATGKDIQTSDLLKSLSEHAYELINGTLGQENKRVTDDKSEAEKKVHTQKLELVVNDFRHTNYTTTVQHTRSTGLSPRIIKDLQDIIADCKKIPPIADSIGRFSRIDKKWAPIAAEAERVSGRAQDVLDADYDTADKHGETLLGR